MTAGARSGLELVLMPEGAIQELRQASALRRFQKPLGIASHLRRNVDGDSRELREVKAEVLVVDLVSIDDSHPRTASATIAVKERSFASTVSILGRSFLCVRMTVSVSQSSTIRQAAATAACS